VDHYFRPKSITKEEVLKYNSPIVLLEDGLDRTYRSTNRLVLKLLVSNFSSDAFPGELTWEVKAGGQSIAKRQISLNNVPQGQVAEAAKIDLELPLTASPAKLTITAELIAGERRFSNDWCSWLYPAAIRPAASPTPVFADETQIKLHSDWGLKPIPATGDLNSKAVYVVKWPCDPRVVDAMKRGASVVVLEGAGQLLKSRGFTYRTTWWKAGDSPDNNNNNVGTFVYDHPVARAMAPDGWCDDGWLYLIEGAEKCVLETAPARPNVIVRALPSLALVEDDALLFEVGVEKGSLIVSGLNHRRAPSRPENEWIVARLLDYAATFPQLKVQWPASFLSVVSVAPEGCIAGFGRLVVNEGEDGIWHSYREDKRVEFQFDSRRTLSVDQFGLFRLTVPRDMLKPGEPCVLGVRSLGTGSRRWFGLNGYF
jgi:hypothetical protein